MSKLWYLLRAIKVSQDIWHLSWWSILYPFGISKLQIGFRHLLHIKEGSGLANVSNVLLWMMIASYRDPTKAEVLVLHQVNAPGDPDADSHSGADADAGICICTAILIFLMTSWYWLYHTTSSSQNSNYIFSHLSGIIFYLRIEKWSLPFKNFATIPVYDICHWRSWDLICFPRKWLDWRKKEDKIWFHLAG